MHLNIDVNFRVNRLVRNLIFVDLALFGGWGLMEPVLSIFIVGEVAGATIITVGVAAAIYWLLKSVLQLAIANYLDRRPGEEDDLKALMASLLVAAVAAFSFSLITEVWQLYVAQVLHAIAFALYVPSWASIFSRHLDRERVAFDWSLDSAAVGIGAGAAGFLGSVIVSSFGFRAVFVLAAVFSFLSFILLLFAPRITLPPPTVKQGAGMKDHTPAHIGK